MNGAAHMTSRLTTTFLRALFVVITLSPASPAQAYWGYTDLVYDKPGNFLLRGYTATFRDPWDAFDGIYYEPMCECDIYYQQFAEVRGALFNPQNQIFAGPAFLSSPGNAVIDLPPFRPLRAGNWRIAAEHYFRTEYYYASNGGYITSSGSIYIHSSSRTANVPCVVPYGETTFSDGWNDIVNNPTVHRFRMRLKPGPASASFSGVRVKELEAGNANSCYDPRMSVGLFHLTGSGYPATLGWVAGVDNMYAFDYVGYFPEAVAQIRIERANLGLPMPCDVVVPQWMYLYSCSDGTQPVYERHNIRLVVNNTTVSVERDGVGGTRTWPGTPPPQPAGDVLASGQSLHPGQYRRSANGEYELAYQGDGNLVLYRLSDGVPLWATMTFAPGEVSMQGDGNLVVYNSAGGVLWSTGTVGYGGAYLVVQNDSNLVIYDVVGTPIWTR